MGEYFVKCPLKRSPVHPGEILREDVLPAIGLFPFSPLAKSIEQLLPITHVFVNGRCSCFCS